MALSREEELAKQVPGFDLRLVTKSTPPTLDYTLSTLYKLNIERELYFSNESSANGTELLNLSSVRPFEGGLSEFDVSVMGSQFPSSETASSAVSKKKQKSSQLDGQYLVIIRHGKTEYNKLGIFTGELLCFIYFD